MKGLIVKELTTMKKSGIMLILAAIVLPFVSKGSITDIMLFLSLMLSIFEISYITSDEMSKWTVFSLALPFSRRDIVTSKYMVIAGITLVCAAVNLSVSGVMSAMGNGSLTSGLNSVCLTVVIGLIYPALALPIIYKFSAVKGRIILALVSGVGAGFAGSLMTISMAASSVIGSSFIESISMNTTLLIGAAAAVIIFAASWLLSVKIYEKREL